MLCLTLISLCPNLEMSEYYKKELPKNELQPLCASVTLSLLEPPSASVSYSVLESLSTLQPKDLSLYENESKNLPLYESEPNNLSLYENEFKNLPLYENKSKNRSLYEKESLSALQPKDLPLYERETLSTLQSQYEMVTSSLPLSASLSLPDSGTSGGSGRSTGNHRSHPPALQPGIWDRIKNACLRSWSINKQALCWAMFVTKEMKRTFRSVESGVFKLLCWECQKSRSYMDDDGCREYTLVGKNGRSRRECQCASTLKSVKCTVRPAVHRHAKPQRICS